MFIATEVTSLVGPINNENSAVSRVHFSAHGSHLPLHENKFERRACVKGTANNLCEATGNAA